MFESTFILRFTHRDCSEIEEQEHTAASTAWEAFRALEMRFSVRLKEIWRRRVKVFPRRLNPPCGRS